MPNPRPYDAADIVGGNEQEGSSLLATERGEAEPTQPSRPPHRRQSSLVQAPPNGAPRTPRTSNRVRFDVEERRSYEINGHARPGSIDSQDSLEEVNYILDGRRSNTGQRAPLLTDVEAPSVTAALEFNAEDLLESARPKSGMRSAFMNMANSIIGAGIIGMPNGSTIDQYLSPDKLVVGQPYAFRQAGLTMGIILLVVLTVTVCSTCNSTEPNVNHTIGRLDDTARIHSPYT